MPSAMKVVAVLLAACLASAAEDRATSSLRGNRSLSNAPQNATQPKERSSHEAAGSQLPAVNLSLVMTNESVLLEGNISQDAILRAQGRGWRGWAQGGDKMWGVGAGIEAINSGNVDYYDRGMAKALSRCGGAGCALITNPPGHRTINQFHIHFVNYAEYGANLKRRLESKVCGKSGWHRGGLPCHGRAAFFGGFPGVFTAAMGGTSSLHHASVIAWPQSCGGKGTIVELAFHCSIEHQIRGDFNPNYR